MGPWQGQGIKVDENWLKKTLSDKIKDIDWNAAKADVVRFLKANELPSLSLWSPELFLSRLNKIFQ